MMRWTLSWLLMFTLIAAVAARGVAQTTVPAVQSAATTQTVDDGDFAPMLFVLVVLALLVVLFVVAAGIVVGLIAMAILASLVFFGVLSTSVLVGVKSRRFEAAARALYIQVAAIGGIVAGAVAFWATAWLLQLHWRTRTILVGGGVAGLIVGVLVGLALNAIWCRVRVWLISHRPGNALEIAPSKPVASDH